MVWTRITRGRYKPKPGLANLWHAERFPWRDIHCCRSFLKFILPDQRLCIVKNMCIYTHVCVQTVYELPLLSNNMFTHIYTNRSGAKCGLDIYHWGAGVAVTGRIRDIGQNVLQYSFVTGSSSAPVTSLSRSSRRPLL